MAASSLINHLRTESSFTKRSEIPKSIRLLNMMQGRLLLNELSCKKVFTIYRRWLGKNYREPQAFGVITKTKAGRKLVDWEVDCHLSQRHTTRLRGA